MICVSKNKRSAGANGLQGETGQDPRIEEREMREGKGEKGREGTYAMRNGPVWGSSSDQGWQARSTHDLAPAPAKRARTGEIGYSLST
jgi:hypothetical protein